MKLTGSRARAFCARPDRARHGALLYGTDGSQVALRRQELVRSLAEGDELALTRLDAAQAARDPAAVDAALRARGFFAGRPVVLIEGAGDALARPLSGILPEIRGDDGFLVVTAGSLPARSGLRKLFEDASTLVSLPFHAGPLEPGELDDLLADSGLQGRLTLAAADELAAVAETLDRGALAQLIEKIAVYMLERDAPLETAELAGLLPGAAEAQLDRLVAAVAEGRAEAVGPLMTRLDAAGVGPVAMLIAASRHFRTLLALATAPDGIGPALGRLRPPVYGPRRDALAAQARGWDGGRLEAALRLLFQTDRRLRSPGDRPDRALVERGLLRLAMMAAQRPRG